MNDRNKMLASDSIGKLLLKLSAPAMVGMMVQALYNIVDTIFVGRGIGPMAIASLAVAFPIQMIVMAFAQTIGVGGASIISRSLGSGNMERAEKTMGNIISMVLILSFAIAVLGSIFITPILKIFGATETILPYGHDYLQVIFIGTIFFAFAMSTNNVVRAEGNAKIAMGTMLISGGLNIVLDPIFIFGLKMGVSGAAIATVLAQATTAIYLAFYFLKGKSTIRIHLKYLKLDLSILREIFTIGASEFVRLVAGSIMLVVLNNSLSAYGGAMSIAIFGIVYRLLMFFFMPIFGVVQGLQPIVGFNYGANQLDRVKNAIYLASKVTTIMSTGSFLLLMLFPETLLGIFSTDTTLIDSGVNAVQIIGLALPVVGFQMVGASTFQSLGKAMPALILSMSRQILFFIPLVLILPLFFGLKGIWIAFPAADICSFTVTLITVMGEMKLISRNLALNTN